MAAREDYGFSCPHLALGSLVLIGLASSEHLGGGTMVALPIVAIPISMSGKAWIESKLVYEQCESI